MSVLSLFDGMSCGQLALERAGIETDVYFSSEIDKYAIKITTKNFPETVHLGDATTFNLDSLPKIDLLLGGSPCQGFSFAGKQLAFDDPRSKLFFTYAHVLYYLREKNPDVLFLLENVRMKKEHRDVITKYLEVEPILINSKLVSAQNRERYYWTNIPGITQPEDKGIMLKDIVFTDAEDPTVCMHNLYGGFKEKSHRTFLEKSPTIRTAAGGGHIPSLLHSEKAIKYMGRKVKGGRDHWDFKHHSDTANEKSAAVVANFFKGVPYNVLKDNGLIRKFHPIECERLQTIPDDYTEGVSNTNRYKMIGNGWTIDVVAHILKNILLEGD